MDALGGLIDNVAPNGMPLWDSIPFVWKIVGGFFVGLFVSAIFSAFNRKSKE